jgi:hypothetical protein
MFVWAIVIRFYAGTRNSSRFRNVLTEYGLQETSCSDGSPVLSLEGGQGGRRVKLITQPSLASRLRIKLSKINNTRENKVFHEHRRRSLRLFFECKWHRTMFGCEVEVRFSLCVRRAMEYKAPLTLYLNTKWKWVLVWTPRSHYPSDTHWIGIGWASETVWNRNLPVPELTHRMCRKLNLKTPFAFSSQEGKATACGWQRILVRNMHSC